MEIHFALHAHFLPITQNDLTLARFLNSQDLPPLIPVVFIPTVPGHPILAVCDRNKLASVRFSKFTIFSDYRPIIGGQQVGPDFFRQLDAFITGVKHFKPSANTPLTVYEIITTKQSVFNGFGACTTNELLHLARIHPLERATWIFNHSDHHKRLPAALQQLWDIFSGPSYHLNIPSITAPTGSTFHNPSGPTLYRVKITKVYRKTAGTGTARVPLDLYQTLLAQGQIDPLPVSPSSIGRARQASQWRVLPVQVWKFQPINPQADANQTTLQLGRSSSQPTLPVSRLPIQTTLQLGQAAPAASSSQPAPVPLISAILNRPTSKWEYVYTVIKAPIHPSPRRAMQKLQHGSAEYHLKDLTSSEPTIGARSFKDGVDLAIT